MTIFRKREVRQYAGIGSPGDGCSWTGPLATCHKLVYRILIQPTRPRVGIGTTSAIVDCRRMARQFMPLWLRLAGRKPILKKSVGEVKDDGKAAYECSTPTWQRQPVRVSFQSQEGQKLT